jgi:6-phosphogluconolactonase
MSPLGRRLRLALVVLTSVIVADDGFVVLVGGLGGSAPLEQFWLSSRSGGLTSTGTLSAGAGTSWLTISPDSRYVYVSNAAAVTTGGVAWPPGASAGGFASLPTLSVLSSQALPPDVGGSPTHMALAGGALYTVSYGAGTGTALGVSTANGSTFLSAPPAPLCGNPHQLVLVPSRVSNGAQSWTAIVPCLGDDSVLLLNTGGGCVGPLGSLCTGGVASSRPGSGPRHAVLHPRLAVAYVLNELDSSIGTWAVDVAGLSMSSAVYTSSLPPDAPWAGNASAWGAGEVALNADASVLYVSNRPLLPGVASTIGAFALNPATGSIVRAIGFYDGAGLLKFPRHFSLTPDGRYLLAASQKGGNIVVFGVQPDGSLTTAAVAETAGWSPSWVGVLPWPAPRPASAAPHAYVSAVTAGAALLVALACARAQA